MAVRQVPAHIKETLVGSWFTVDPTQVMRVAILYSGVGLLHFLLRKPCFELTNAPHDATGGARRVLWWDFLFYATFGLVVTSAVQIAGVLLVFGLLVIPAVAGLMATSRTGAALMIGWVFGFTASVVGLLGSVQFDMPATPSILVALTGLLLVYAVMLSVWRRWRGVRATPTP